MTDEEFDYVLAELHRRTDEGDKFASLCLAALELLASAVPPERPDPGGGEVVEFRRAA